MALHLRTAVISGLSGWITGVCRSYSLAMDRRTYLAQCATFGSVAVLAGCTDSSLKEMKNPPPWADVRFDEAEIDLPISQKFDVVERGISRAEGETFEEPTAFKAYLRDEGLAIETLEEVEKHGKAVLELESVVSEVIEEGNAHTAGLVAGGYAALVRGGYDGNELRVSLLEPDGSPFGEFTVMTSWAEEYNEGTKSAAVYGSEVIHTLEST